MADSLTQSVPAAQDQIHHAEGQDSVDWEDEIAACENCGNTDQDGTDDCIDCGLENAFS